MVTRRRAAAPRGTATAGTTDPPPRLRLIDRAHRLLFLGVSVLHRLGVPLHRRIADWQHRRPDHWHYATSDYERARFAGVLRAIGPGPFARCLEIPCSEGVFTELLAANPIIGEIVALDVSPRALSRARRRLGRFSHVHLAEHDLAAPEALPGAFDLVCSMDVFLYLGVNLGRAARKVCAAVAPGGLLVLLHPWSDSRHAFAPFLEHPGFTEVASIIERHPVRTHHILVLRRTG